MDERISKNITYTQTDTPFFIFLSFFFEKNSAKLSTAMIRQSKIIQSIQLNWIKLYNFKCN